MLTNINSTKQATTCQTEDSILASIARMETELKKHKSFLQIIAEESAGEQLNVTEQAEELETLRK